MKIPQQQRHQHQQEAGHGRGGAASPDSASSPHSAVLHHTRFVLFSKHIMLLLVVTLVAGIIIVPLWRQEDAGIRVAFSSVEQSGNPIMPRMIRPRLQGVDADNNPFLITAEEATQPGEDIVELYNLKADFMLEGKSWLALTARGARVDMTNKKMQLQGDVSVFHDGGYELHTEKAYIDMDKTMAYGDNKVTGQGDIGVLQAGGFRVYNRGEKVSFVRGVKLTIYPEKGMWDE